MILVLSDLWPPFPGGAERLAFNLARMVMQRGYDVEVVTGYELAQQFDGPPVTIRDDIHVLDRREDGAVVIKEILASMQPDVILTHHLYAYQFEAELIECGIPVVQVVLNTRRLDCARFAVYISKWVRSTLGDARAGDLVITPPAFDDIIAPYHGNDIGFIKPFPHKGIDLIYKIAARLPDRSFRILRGEWQDLEVIEQRPNITFMEPVDDIRDFYKHCRLVLMPSRSEDAGTVAQECALNDLPCITSNVEGLAQTNEGGLRLDPDDLGAWVTAIQLCDCAPVVDALVHRQRAGFARAQKRNRYDLFLAGIAKLAG